MRRTVKDRFRATVLVGMILVLTGSSKPAEDPQATFEQVFGAEARKVSASGNVKEQAAFAAKLLDGAKSLATSPDVQTLLLEKAVEFSTKDLAGRQTALESLELLGKVAPARGEDWDVKAIDVNRNFYRLAVGPDRRKIGQVLVDLLVARSDQLVQVGKAGDAVALIQEAKTVTAGVGGDPGALNERLREATASAALEKRIQALKSQLQADPASARAARELVLLYVIEMDDPDEAAKYVSACGEEVLRTYVPLAAQDLGNVAETACLELGAWYRSLASQTVSVKGKLTVLTRAKACYERVLQSSSTTAAVRLQAQAGLTQVNADIARLPKSAMSASSAGLPDKVGEILRFKGHAASVDGIFLGQDCGRLFSWSSGEQRMRVWDTRTGKQATQLPCDGCRSIDLSPDGKKLTWANFGRAKVWDLEAGSATDGPWTQPVDRQAVAELVAFGGNDVLVCVSGSTIRRYDIKTGKETASMPYEGTAHSFTLDRKLLMGSSDSEMLWISPDTGKLVAKAPRPATGSLNPNYIKQSFDGKWLVVRERPLGSFVYDNVSGKLVVRLPDLLGGQLMPGGKLAARFRVSGSDANVEFFESTTGRVAAKIPVVASPHALLVAPGGKHVFFVTPQNEIVLWGLP